MMLCIPAKLPVWRSTAQSFDLRKPSLAQLTPSKNMTGHGYIRL